MESIKGFSENPTDFPNIRFPFTKLVTKQSQLIIHEHLSGHCKMTDELHRQQTEKGK